jgi:hypothetical protein
MNNRILVVAYSYTGTSLRLAQWLCSLQGWELGRIEEVAPRRGAMGTLSCVMDSLLRRRPEIEYVGPAPDRFDAVVLVSPIWMYRLASPMRSFVARYQRQLRGIAVVLVMGGKGAPNAVAEIGALANRSPLLSTAFTQREVDDGSCAPRLQAFAEALSKATSQAGSQRTAEWSPRAA